MNTRLARRFAFLGVIIVLAPGAVASETVSLETGTDRLGADYKGFALDGSEPQLCRQACADDPACKAYSYVKPGVKGPKAMCFLKSSVAPATPNDCCTSGSKTSATPSALVLLPSMPLHVKTPSTAKPPKATMDLDPDERFKRIETKLLEQGELIEDQQDAIAKLKAKQVELQDEVADQGSCVVFLRMQIKELTNPPTAGDSVVVGQPMSLSELGANCD